MHAIETRNGNLGCGEGLIERGGCAVQGLGKKKGCDIGKVKNDLWVLKYGDSKFRKFGIFMLAWPQLVGTE